MTRRGGIMAVGCLVVSGLLGGIVSSLPATHRKAIVISKTAGTPSDSAERAALTSWLQSRVSPTGRYRRIDSINIRRNTLGTVSALSGLIPQLQQVEGFPAWSNLQQSVYLVYMTGSFDMAPNLTSGETSTWNVEVLTTSEPWQILFERSNDTSTMSGTPPFNVAAIPDTSSSS